MALLLGAVGLLLPAAVLSQCGQPYTTLADAWRATTHDAKGPSGSYSGDVRRTLPSPRCVSLLKHLLAAAFAWSGGQHLVDVRRRAAARDERWERRVVPFRGQRWGCAAAALATVSTLWHRPRRLVVGLGTVQRYTASRLRRARQLPFAWCWRGQRNSVLRLLRPKLRWLVPQPRDGWRRELRRLLPVAAALRTRLRQRVLHRAELAAAAATATWPLEWP